MNPHRAEDFPTACQQGFIQFERRNAESEQATDFWMAIVHRHLYAIAGENICTGQPCRTRTDNRHPLVHFGDMA
ncbi:hypothetical protein ExPCM12_04256 [Escherichia coli]|nr:hypothetical protein ExPCM12_04256 [Escherichia coli]